MNLKIQVFCVAITAGLMLAPARAADSGGGAKGKAISVGGMYAMQVSVQKDDCGGVQPQPYPTLVKHTPGATRLTLRRARNTYTGKLEPNGAFSTAPHRLFSNDGSLNISIVGKFTRTGFDAEVTVDVKRQAKPQSCRYVIHWVGTKEGEPNVIPEAKGAGGRSGVATGHGGTIAEAILEPELWIPE